MCLYIAFKKKKKKEHPQLIVDIIKVMYVINIHKPLMFEDNRKIVIE